MKPKYTIYPVAIAGFILTLGGSITHDWYILVAGAVLYIPDIIARNDF